MSQSIPRTAWKLLRDALAAIVAMIVVWGASSGIDVEGLDDIEAIIVVVVLFAWRLVRDDVPWTSGLLKRE